MSAMDLSVRQELISSIEQLTHSGAPALNDELLKKVKKICKTADAYVRTAYDRVMADLVEEHAEIRLSAFQLSNELFHRSHIFRELLISEFQKFASLVTGTDPKQPLPLPRPAAQRLKEQSLLAIRGWNEKFGEGYPRLRLGFNYLKHNKKVNFDELVAQSEAARRRREEREARQRTIREQRLQEVKQEMREQKCNIEDCLRQMDACFNLLLPRFDIPEMSTFALSASPRSNPAGKKVKFHKLRRRTLSSGSFASLGSSDFSSDEEFGDRDMEAEFGVSQAEKGGLVGESSSCQTIAETETEVSGCTDGTPDIKEPSSVNENETEAVDGNKTEAVDENETKAVDGNETEAVDGNETEAVDGKETKAVDGNETEAVDGNETRGSSTYITAGVETGIAGGDEEGSGSNDSEVEWEEVEEGEESLLQQHGFTSHGMTIPIEIDLSNRVRLEEDEDNSSILATLRENQRLLRDKFLPALGRWLEWLTKAGDEESLRMAIDLKNRLLATQEKFGRLNIVPPPTEDSSQSEAKETRGLVPEPKPPTETDPQWKISADSHSTTTTTTGAASLRVESELDPTTPQAQFAVLRKRLGLSSSKLAESSSGLPSSGAKLRHTGSVSGAQGTATDAKQALLSRAPVVPFGADLYSWESQEDVEPTTVVLPGSLHRFWVPEQDMVLSEDERAKMKCRIITFAGKFEPVKWVCRAPLSNGNLCQRRDRLKCPFHGPIIPRDEHGQPADIPDPRTHTSSNPEHSGSSEAGPSWQDIQGEVMTAKGIEPVGSRKKKGKGKQPKYPGLTDLTAHADTTRKRLERKVLSRKSLRRVADAMDDLSAKRFKDKFGYNFNYALRS